MDSKKKLRPEDRTGIRQETAFARLLVGFYLGFARLWRRLPLFKGRVRVAVLLRKLLGLANQHIQETVKLTLPTEYLAHLDLHSWHEFVAYFDGGYEADTVEFLSRCYDDTGYFLDLGANIGLIAVPFVKLNQSKGDTISKAYCVEAVTSNYQRLQKNIEINALVDNLVPINVGVGEAEKVVFIQVEGNLKDGEGTGTANVLADNTAHAAERIPLEITTLDMLLTNKTLPENCSLIKIDLDGYDLKALEGGRSLITKARPVIYGEFSAHCMSWHGQTHKDVESFMHAFDYEVFYRVGGSWQFSQEATGDDGDLLILPLERRKDFAWCL